MAIQKKFFNSGVWEKSRTRGYNSVKRIHPFLFGSNSFLLRQTLQGSCWKEGFFFFFALLSPFASEEHFLRVGYRPPGLPPPFLLPEEKKV